MPELPEVETIRRTLEPIILGKMIRRSELHRRDILIAPGDPSGGFSRQRAGHAFPRPIAPEDLLEGFTIHAVGRLGKQLVLVARRGRTPERALIVQLGMTGRLLFEAHTTPSPAHTHATWHLDHGRLVFFDPRRFGGLRAFASAAALHSHLAALGPDALSITETQLAEALQGAKTPIKAALLDQARLSGVGNIYADEALFLSQIHPRHAAGKLSPRAVQSLAKGVRSVLADAVAKGGSTLRDYADVLGRGGAFQHEHRVYGRGGQPCVVCKTQLRHGAVAQRTTVWCPRCQPKRG